jgi:uncharacterized membrane protein
MNAAQIHLMLNHMPVIGLIFVVIALGAGVLTRKDTLVRFGLVLLVGLGLAVIPVFLSGEPAEEGVEHMAGVTERAIEPHEDMARIATIALVGLGLFALIGLLRTRRRPVGRELTAAALILSVAAGAMLAWTAHLGGQIHHPELRDAGLSADAAPGERGDDDD